MKNILTGRIGAGLSLFGRSGFFFEPDNGANANGGVSQEGATNNEPNNQNGQNQNQQQTDWKSPFDAIDRNLLDDHTRSVLDKAEQDFKNTHGRAQQASKFQSEADTLKAQLKAYDERLQSLQNGNNTNQQNQQQQKAKSFEDELVEMYKTEGGLDDAAAQRLAKLNGKVFSNFGNRFQNGIHQQLAPVLGNAMDAAARNAFEEAMQTDEYGLFQNPDLSQQVWEQVVALGKTQEVTPALIQNLAKIHSFNTKTNNTVTANNNPPNPNPMSVNTRFTFPGAGHSVQLPARQNTNVPVDAETQAALAATFSNWPVKPKGFTPPANMQGRVTRGV